MHPYFPRTPLLQGADVEAKRAELLHYFHATFDRYESLFQVLACDEAYYRKPIALRHPLIFYFGHSATFFINKLLLAGLIDRRIDPRLESMFAVGVDEMSWDDLNDAHYDWPSVAEVRAYRDQARAVVDGVIRNTPFSLPIGWSDPVWVVLMGIEHERIHLETSSVLIRQHALKMVRPHPDWQPCRESGAAPLNTLVGIAHGHVRLGRALEDPFYGWDNEYGHRHAEVPAFQASRHLVSNGEFLEFVNSGGYADHSLWDEEGQAWRRYARAEFPTFWVPTETGWRLRLLAEEVPMPWDWPVETNCLEARAFCRWKSVRTGTSVRLPTEDEWHRLHDHARPGSVLHDVAAPANLHLDHWASSCPVNRFSHGDLSDVVGNVWQWCETAIYPFDGFRVHPIYDDFTSPTFDNRHNIMKGGSWISTGNESRHVSRYAFRRHFFQHAGFRYVVTDRPAAQPAAIYETDTMVSQYAEFHYGSPALGVPNFPQALAQLALDAHQRHGNGRSGRALDVGCATGRATFELARYFDRVVGIDFSGRFIELAARMAQAGSIRYVRTEEGDLTSHQERRLEELGLKPFAGRVEFWQGDACNLKEIFTGFDLILAVNLIDRLYAPRRFLQDVADRLNPGGLLVLATPCTWMEEYTDRSEWIGGFRKDGEPCTTLDGLDDALGDRFIRMDEPREVPFVIRETRRKHQHTLSEVTVWKRRS